MKIQKMAMNYYWLLVYHDGLSAIVQLLPSESYILLQKLILIQDMNYYKLLIRIVWRRESRGVSEIAT